MALTIAPVTPSFAAEVGDVDLSRPLSAAELTEVREAFAVADAGAVECFGVSPSSRWLADLYGLARRRLERCGVGSVGGGGLCTYSDAGRFFSFRRDGATGRMASLIWLGG
jgi:hypothetical protein